jgi:hypothetical protein
MRRVAVCQRWGVAASLASPQPHGESMIVQKGEAENVIVQGDEEEKDRIPKMRKHSLEKESGIVDGSTEEVASAKAKMNVAFLRLAAKVDGKGIVPAMGNGFADASQGSFSEEESNFQGTQACKGQDTKARKRRS